MLTLTVTGLSVLQRSLYNGELERQWWPPVCTAVRTAGPTSVCSPCPPVRPPGSRTGTARRRRSSWRRRRWGWTMILSKTITRHDDNLGVTWGELPPKPTCTTPPYLRPSPPHNSDQGRETVIVTQHSSSHNNGKSSTSRLHCQLQKAVSLLSGDYRYEVPPNYEFD